VTPASACIIGSTGVKAKRPMPIATANATSPVHAVTSADMAAV
jgi:hypothetical protein